MHSVHPVFHVSILEPAISNTFSKKIQLALTLVIIDRKPKYEISWIVDSKIDYQRVCKLLYKIIWLGYKNTRDESEWIPVTELTHAANLVSNFHIAYPAKPCSLPLSWSCCYTCPLPPHIFQQGFSFTNSLVYSVCLFSLTLSFYTLFRISFQNFISFYLLDSLTHTLDDKKENNN